MPNRHFYFYPMHVIICFERGKIYEEILGKKLDRRNFRKKIISSKNIISTEQEENFEGKKKAKIYKFIEG